MSLLGPLIELADSLTKSFGLQADVTHLVWDSQSGSGAGEFTSVLRSAIVEKKSRLLRAPGGAEVQSQASVLFLSPVTVKAKDKIQLPDGTIGPILTLDGFVDDTQAAVLTQVFLGV